MRPSISTFAALLLSLLLATAILCWLRSERVSDTVSWTLGKSNVEIASQRGHVALLIVHDNALPHELLRRSFTPDTADWWFADMLTPITASYWRGFGHAQGRTRQSDFAYRLIQTPWWAVALLLAVWPARVAIAAALSSARRRYRKANNLCPHCAYDLTGNLSGRCPECGGMAVQRVGARVTKLAQHS